MPRINLSKKELEILLWMIRPWEPSDDWTDKQIATAENVTRILEKIGEGE